MLYDREGRLMSRTGRALTAQATPGPSAEWFVIKLFRSRGFLLGRGKFELSASEDGALRFRKLGTVFRLVSAKGCTPYPEAGPGATGRPFRGTNPDGTVFGFADTHLHITAEPPRRRARHPRRAVRPLRDHRGARARRTTTTAPTAART